MSDFAFRGAVPANGFARTLRRVLAGLALGLLLFSGGAVAARSATVSLLDRLGAQQGSAKVNLAKGSVKAKMTLAPLPATVDTGTAQFQATIYKAYLVSSTDPDVEIPLGNLYPKSTGNAVVKSAVKGDLSGLGFDRLVIVAFSKDGLDSFEVLTGTIAP